MPSSARRRRARRHAGWLGARCAIPHRLVRELRGTTIGNRQLNGEVRQRNVWLAPMWPAARSGILWIVDGRGNGHGANEL
jgi:hypothetical protein